MQRGKIGRWKGWTQDQARRLGAVGVTPRDLEKRFRQHHLSRGTFSECWQAEAENWVDSEERRARGPSAMGASSSRLRVVGDDEFCVVVDA